MSGNLRRPPLSRGKRHQRPVCFLRAQERRHLSAAGRIARWRCTVTHTKKTQDGGKENLLFSLEYLGKKKKKSQNVPFRGLFFAAADICWTVQQASNRGPGCPCRQLHGGRRPSRLQEDMRQPSLLLRVRPRGRGPLSRRLQVPGDRLQLRTERWG